MPTAPQPQSNADQVLAEHRELRALLTHLEGFTEQPRPEIGNDGFHRWAANLSKGLVELHDKLFRHFRFETASGVFDELVKLHPRGAKPLQELQLQHPRLLKEVRELVHSSLRYSQGDEPANPRLRKRLKEILTLLSNHEDCESELLTRLLGRDIGAVD